MWIRTTVETIPYCFKTEHLVAFKQHNERQTWIELSNRAYRVIDMPIHSLVCIMWENGEIPDGSPVAQFMVV